jgi:hypothetical protein
MDVFSHQAHGVLNRHAVARKGHHARAQFKMQRIERGIEQSSGVSGQISSPRAM